MDKGYCNQGIGSYLLQEAERELKAKGAYVILIWLYDWQEAFFEKRGFTVCTVTEDRPKGHRRYGMKKLL